MLTKEQIKQIERSYSHGDSFVFQIDSRVFVAESVEKDTKSATVIFKECQEVDESCFDNGEYYGEVLGDTKTFTLADCYVGNDSMVASVYYEDEIKEIFNDDTNNLEYQNWYGEENVYAKLQY